MRIKTLATIASLLVVTALSSPSAKAGLLVEPYAGYSFFGSVNNSGTDYGSYNGVGFGARGAIQILDLVFGGVDASYYPSLGYDPASTGTVFSGGIKNTKVGLVAGVSLPLLPLRFWLGYNFVDKLSGSVGTTDVSLSGNSFKLGAGFKFILVSLNAEYIITSYGSLDVGSVAQALPGGNNFTGKTIVLSASVPLSL
jgi:hypothetical protein